MKSPCSCSGLLSSSAFACAASVCSAGFDHPALRRTPPPARSPLKFRKPAAVAASTVAIPGPLRSFLRMAGISQKISLEEVLPLLARNVAVEGYQGRKDRTGRPTEFLILLKRYVEQARELVTLAGPEGVIRVSNCEQAEPVAADSRLPHASKAAERTLPSKPPIQKAPF